MNSSQMIPENVRFLQPAEIVESEPTNTDIMRKLVEIQKQLSELHTITMENRADIETTKNAISVVVEQVKPTLDMLSTGPIGQLLGIAPKPEPRQRRLRG